MSNVLKEKTSQWRRDQRPKRDESQRNAQRPLPLIIIRKPIGNQCQGRCIRQCRANALQWPRKEQSAVAEVRIERSTFLTSGNNFPLKCRAAYQGDAHPMGQIEKGQGKRFDFVSDSFFKYTVCVCVCIKSMALGVRDSTWLVFFLPSPKN